jgi:hypothetical protein
MLSIRGLQAVQKDAGWTLAGKATVEVATCKVNGLSVQTLQCVSAAAGPLASQLCTTSHMPVFVFVAPGNARAVLHASCCCAARTGGHEHHICIGSGTVQYAQLHCSAGIVCLPGCRETLLLRAGSTAVAVCALLCQKSLEWLLLLCCDADTGMFSSLQPVLLIAGSLRLLVE